MVRDTVRRARELLAAGDQEQAHEILALALDAQGSAAQDVEAIAVAEATGMIVRIEAPSEPRDAVERRIARMAELTDGFDADAVREAPRARRARDDRVGPPVRARRCDRAGRCDASGGVVRGATHRGRSTARCAAGTSGGNVHRRDPAAAPGTRSPSGGGRTRDAGAHARPRNPTTGCVTCALLRSIRRRRSVTTAEMTRSPRSR